MDSTWVLLIAPVLILANLQSCCGNENPSAVSSNMKNEGECLLKNGQEIRKQLQEYSSNKDCPALVNKLEKLLDRDSAAYKQLQSIAGRFYMYNIGYYDLKELAEVLVLCGDAIHIADSSGFTMLHGAAMDGHLQLVKWLIDHGAFIESIDNYGHTPLICAALNGQLETVKWLTEHGANVDSSDSSGNTSLMYAALFSFRDVVTTLVAAGASTVVRNKSGQTALDVARKVHSITVIPYLSRLPH